MFYDDGVIRLTDEGNIDKVNNRHEVIWLDDELEGYGWLVDDWGKVSLMVLTDEGVLDGDTYGDRIWVSILGISDWMKLYGQLSDKLARAIKIPLRYVKTCRQGIHWYRIGISLTGMGNVEDEIGRIPRVCKCGGTLHRVRDKLMCVRGMGCSAQEDNRYMYWFRDRLSIRDTRKMIDRLIALNTPTGYGIVNVMARCDSVEDLSEIWVDKTSMELRAIGTTLLQDMQMTLREYILRYSPCGVKIRDVQVLYGDYFDMPLKQIPMSVYKNAVFDKLTRLQDALYNDVIVSMLEILGLGMGEDSLPVNERVVEDTTTQDDDLQGSLF